MFSRSDLKGSAFDEVDDDDEEAPAGHLVVDRFVGIAKEWTADGKQQEIREQIVVPMTPKPIAPGN